MIATWYVHDRMGQRAVHGPLKAVPVRWQDCLATPLRCAENRENTKLRLVVSFSSHILASSLVQYASCNLFPYVKVWMGFSVCHVPPLPPASRGSRGPQLV